MNFSTPASKSYRETEDESPGFSHLSLTEHSPLRVDPQIFENNVSDKDTEPNDRRLKTNNSNDMGRLLVTPRKFDSPETEHGKLITTTMILEVDLVKRGMLTRSTSLPELSNSFMIHPMFKKKKYGQPQVRTRSLSLSEMVGEMTMNELDNQSDFGNSEDECVTDSEREVVVDESIGPMVGEVNLSPTTIEVVVDKLIEPTVGEVNLGPTTIEVAVDKLIEPTVGEVNLRPDCGGGKCGYSG